LLRWDRDEHKSHCPARGRIPQVRTSQEENRAREVSWSPTRIRPPVVSHVGSLDGLEQLHQSDQCPKSLRLGHSETATPAQGLSDGSCGKPQEQCGDDRPGVVADGQLLRPAPGRPRRQSRRSLVVRFGRRRRAGGRRQTGPSRPQQLLLSGVRGGAEVGERLPCLPSKPAAGPGEPQWMLARASPGPNQ
jgi:hypothetical protein